jgi:hypothetical protein
MGLFFMTVGMEISVGLFFAKWKSVLAGISMLILGKTAVVAAVGGMFGLSITQVRNWKQPTLQSSCCSPCCTLWWVTAQMLSLVHFLYDDVSRNNASRNNASLNNASLNNASLNNMPHHSRFVPASC